MEFELTRLLQTKAVAAAKTKAEKADKKPVKAEKKPVAKKVATAVKKTVSARSRAHASCRRVSLTIPLCAGQACLDWIAGE